MALPSTATASPSAPAVVLPQAIVYTPALAAIYADTYAKNANNLHYYVYSDDCTNFVSQAIYAGGEPYKKQPAGTDIDKASDQYWYEISSVYTGHPASQSNTNSWTVVTDNKNFLSSYASIKETAKGTEPGSDYFTTDDVGVGDILRFDWDGNGTLDHEVIQVGFGTDPAQSTYGGDYVDEHTTNRYHAFWSLLPYNSKWATTVIHEYKM